MTGRSRSGSGTSPGSRTDADDRGAARQDRRLSLMRGRARARPRRARRRPRDKSISHGPCSSARSPKVRRGSSASAFRRTPSPRSGQASAHSASRFSRTTSTSPRARPRPHRARRSYRGDRVRERRDADADAPRHPRRTERSPVRARRRRVAFRAPDGAVAVPLRRMGAAVRTTDGHAPLAVDGAELHAIDYELPCRPRRSSPPSSSGLYADGETTVERLPTRDHTERLLERAGATVRRRGTSVSVRKADRLVLDSVEIPGDSPPRRRSSSEP